MNLMLIGILLIFMALAYQVGLSRSRAVAHRADGANLHSRPGYYGWLVALWCGIPAFLVFFIWSVIEPGLIQQSIMDTLPNSVVTGLNISGMEVMIHHIHDVAANRALPAAPYEASAAQHLKQIQTTGLIAKVAAVCSVALFGLLYARHRISAQLRARNQIEKIIQLGLIACSAIAILTTVGIVMSMLGEAMRFFQFVHPADFFFGTVWNPGFSTTGSSQGEFGLLPLLWGTLMVSAIALLVAVPLGLMAAIYLAEYASPRFRAIAKPVIEVLAGIPTIVYGVFALLTIGPFFASLGAMMGIEIRATSALTAGFVMGIMIIPFVSSLSDDIITQVPRSLRDGSLGLGATKSETIRKVVIPAALPGIIGAFLLAASRAIGETMIVVLAAGNSPLLHGNPLEAVSTVTVTIVNQLTGDTDFAGPQSLVAFALGLTLFVMTLGLNVIALYIVRKYREQYE
ncbi:phosphate ABC transporter permease subunit PstC [Alkanindiges sp. WGS2144]|uniref:phosphate ABC transporter permease subunit PstC n=1 Tax=Alkanindiges sp. WGS2144 TaxID=3366808 RepID=UPI0037506FBE